MPINTDELEFVYKNMLQYHITSYQEEPDVEVKRLNSESKNRLIRLFEKDKLTYTQLRELIDCI